MSYYFTKILNIFRKGLPYLDKKVSDLIQKFFLKQVFISNQNLERINVKSEVSPLFPKMLLQNWMRLFFQF